MASLPINLFDDLDGDQQKIIIMIMREFINDDLIMSVPKVPLNTIYSEIFDSKKISDPNLICFLNELDRPTLPPHSLNKDELEAKAKKFGKCLKTMERRLKIVIKMTLTEIRQRLSLLYCIEELKDLTLSITEIAIDGGYSSCSNFTKAFKKYYKISPKEYRKRFRDGMI